MIFFWFSALCALCFYLGYDYGRARTYSEFYADIDELPETEWDEVER